MLRPQCDPNKLVFGMKVWLQNSQSFFWHEGPITLASTIHLTLTMIDMVFPIGITIISSTLHEVIFDLSIPFLLFFLIIVRKSYSHLNSFHDCYVRFVVYLYNN